MLNAVLMAVVALSAVWVYLDATRHKIGLIRNEEGKAKGGWNMSAGVWASVVLGFWIVGFPAYLAKRSSLIEKAKGTPVNVTGRGWKVAALSIAGGVCVILAIATIPTELPGCDYPNVEKTVGDIINEQPGVKEAGIRFVDLKGIEERGYNKESELRSCGATMVSTVSEDKLQYLIKWSDKHKQEYSVEARWQQAPTPAPVSVDTAYPVEPVIVTLQGVLISAQGETPDGEKLNFPAIQLVKPIVVNGDDDHGEATGVDLMQLVLDNKSWGQFEMLKGKSVTIKGTLYHRDFGTQHTWVLMKPVEISHIGG